MWTSCTPGAHTQWESVEGVLGAVPAPPPGSWALEGLVSTLLWAKPHQGRLHLASLGLSGLSFAHSWVGSADCTFHAMSL